MKDFKIVAKIGKGFDRLTRQARVPTVKYIESSGSLMVWSMH